MNNILIQHQKQQNTGKIHAKSRSQCGRLRNQVKKFHLTKCKSQLRVLEKGCRDQSLFSRKDSISRKAEFNRLESKQLDDEVNSESSFTSTESQVSLKVERYDNSNPQTYHADSEGESSEFEESKLGDSVYIESSPQSSQLISVHSF